MSQKIPIKKFSFRIILFSAIIAGLTVLFQWLFPQYASPALPFIVLFFFIITLLTMYIVLRVDKGREAKKFVSSYMLSRVITLLSCLVFLLVYILVKKDDAIRFAIAFLAIYFLYSIFEVFLMKKENQEISEKNREA